MASFRKNLWSTEKLLFFELIRKEAVYAFRNGAYDFINISRLGDELHRGQCREFGVCLQEAVKGDGVSISVCEEQKDYQTCKYITGEIFAIIPWTAFFNFITGIIKNALSDPLTAIGVGVSLFCKVECAATPDSTSRFALKYASGTTWFCGFFTWLSFLGEIANEVQSIISGNAWKIQDDMCQYLE